MEIIVDVLIYVESEPKYFLSLLIFTLVFVSCPHGAYGPATERKCEVMLPRFGFICVLSILRVWSSCILAEFSLRPLTLSLSPGG